jgi:hypothetical protein
LAYSLKLRRQHCRTGAFLIKLAALTMVPLFSGPVYSLVACVIQKKGTGMFHSWAALVCCVGAMMAYWMKPNEPFPGTEMGAVSKPA